MKAKKPQNNEDEDVSIWDYVEPFSMLLFILLLAVVGIIVWLCLTGVIPLTPPPPSDPHMHP